MWTTQNLRPRALPSPGPRAPSLPCPSPIAHAPKSNRLMRAFKRAEATGFLCYGQCLGIKILEYLNKLKDLEPDAAEGTWI